MRDVDNEYNQFLQILTWTAGEGTSALLAEIADRMEYETNPNVYDEAPHEAELLNAVLTRDMHFETAERAEIVIKALIASGLDLFLMMDTAAEIGPEVGVRVNVYGTDHIIGPRDRRVMPGETGLYMVAPKEIWNILDHDKDTLFLEEVAWHGVSVGDDTYSLISQAKNPNTEKQVTLDM